MSLFFNHINSNLSKFLDSSYVKIQPLQTKVKSIEKYDKAPKNYLRPNFGIDKKFKRTSTTRQKNDYSKVSKDISVNSVDIRTIKNDVALNNAK